MTSINRNTTTDLNSAALAAAGSVSVVLLAAESLALLAGLLLRPTKGAGHVRVVND